MSRHVGGALLLGIGIGLLLSPLEVIVMLHHSFIFGVSSWSGLITVLAVPVGLILIGAVLLRSGRRS